MRSTEQKRALAAVKSLREKMSREEYKRLKGMALHGEYKQLAEELTALLREGGKDQ